MQERYFWLAINGASVAASSVPFSKSVTVTPTPCTLLGFATREEQLERQAFLLNAPINEVNRYMLEEVPQLVRGGDVVCVSPESPQPPTRGRTLWSETGLPDG